MGLVDLELAGGQLFVPLNQKNRLAAERIVSGQLKPRARKRHEVFAPLPAPNYPQRLKRLADNVGQVVDGLARQPTLNPA